MGSYEHDTQRTNNNNNHPSTTGGVSKKNKKTVSVADIADTEEVKKLRSLYKDKLATLQEMFEDWTEADLLFTLNDAEGDIELTVSRISDGHTSQWGEVKSRKSKKDHSNKTKSAGQPGVSQRGSAGSGVVTNVTGNVGHNNEPQQHHQQQQRNTIGGNGRSRGGGTRGGRRDDRTNNSSRAIKKENGSGHSRTSRQHPNGPSSSFHHNETNNGNQFKSSTTNDSNSWGNNDSSGGGNNWPSDVNNDEFYSNNDWTSSETKSWGDTEPTFTTKSTKNEVVSRGWDDKITSSSSLPVSSQNTATNWSTIEPKTESSWGDEDINISTTTTAISTSNDFSKDDSNLNKDGWGSSSSDTHHNSNELRVSDNSNNNKNSRDFSKSYKNSTTSKPYSYSSSTPTPSSSNKSPVPPKSRTIPAQSKTSWAKIVKPDQKPEHKPETTSTTPIQQHHNNANIKGTIEMVKSLSPSISKTSPPIPTQSPSKVVEQVIINDNNNISINNDFQQKTISTTSTPEIAISEIEENKKKSPSASSPLLNKEVSTLPSNTTGITNVLSISATNTPSSPPSSPTPTSNSLLQQTTPSPSLSAANVAINNNIVSNTITTSIPSSEQENIANSTTTPIISSSSSSSSSPITTSVSPRAKEIIPHSLKSKTTTTKHRLKQDAPVVMPTNGTGVERVGVQFGSLSLSETSEEQIEMVENDLSSLAHKDELSNSSTVVETQQSQSPPPQQQSQQPLNHHQITLPAQQQVTQQQQLQQQQQQQLHQQQQQQLHQQQQTHQQQLQAVQIQLQQQTSNQQQQQTTQVQTQSSNSLSQPTSINRLPTSSSSSTSSSSIQQQPSSINSSAPSSVPTSASNQTSQNYNASYLKQQEQSTGYLNQHHLGGIEPLNAPYTSYMNQPPNQLSQFGIGPIQPDYATIYPAEAQRGVMGYYADPSYPQASPVTSSVGGFQGRDKYSQETSSNSSSTQSASQQTTGTQQSTNQQNQNPQQQQSFPVVPYYHPYYYMTNQFPSAYQQSGYGQPFVNVNKSMYPMYNPHTSKPGSGSGASPYGYPTTPTTPSTPHYSNTGYDEVSPPIHHLPGAVPNVHDYQKTYGGGSGMQPINFLGNAGGVNSNSQPSSVSGGSNTTASSKTGNNNSDLNPQGQYKSYQDKNSASGQQPSSGVGQSGAIQHQQPSSNPNNYYSQQQAQQQVFNSYQYPQNHQYHPHQAHHQGAGNRSQYWNQN